MWYSQSNPEILDPKRRLLVARQIGLILKDYFNGRSFTKMRLLDVGCSSGIITDYLAGSFAKAYGVDIDKKAIPAKKIQSKNLTFKIGDATRLNFPKNYFDVVICNHVYYYIKKQAEHVSEIYRVLKSGGICYFSGINKYSPLKPRQVLPVFYLSYWQLKNLCKQFKIYSYTGKIINNPYKYQNTKLIPFQKILSFLPITLWNMLEPVIPDFIWILKKE
jgi:ubiquinone/menaquinone biosynthesis C-methylase UbiE